MRFYRTLLTAGMLIACAIASAQSNTVVCIDPGHPSEVNPGTTVQNGTTETHIDWVVAEMLRKLLLDKGYRVVMTKFWEMELVRNRRRAEIANGADAALMVRLHCDTSSSRGYAIYYPDRTGTIAGHTGPDADIRARSRQAALAIEAGMRSVLAGSLRDGGVKGDSQTYIGGKQGALTGSVFSNVPIVTIEMVVLRSREDAAFIKRQAGQESMARGIAAGIVRFLNNKIGPR